MHEMKIPMDNFYPWGFFGQPQIMEPSLLKSDAIGL